MLWLMNDKGELLLARRADHKTQDPGLWGPSVTGKLEPGESYRDAAIREAHEELALTPGSYNIGFLLETDFNHPDGELRKFQIFIARINNATIRTLRTDTNEVAALRWLDIPSIRKLLLDTPGRTIVASAFVLWEQIFEALQSTSHS